MKDWKKAIVPPGSSIRETLRVIDYSVTQIALVVDETQHLVGTVTDGDVRRGLLKGLSLDDAVEQVLNLHPIVAGIEEDDVEIEKIMRDRSVNQIPLVDRQGRVVGLQLLKECLSKPKYENLVVLMAGGIGSRLMPLTETCPKPLLQVGGKPLLQIIIENFKSQGFHRFAIAVNHMAEMIEGFLGDGSGMGVEIQYLREPKRLGTAGALRLIDEELSVPVIVMNGDLLTKVNFGHLLDYHQEIESKGTICVREYDVNVPFGIVEVEDDRLVALQEKPVQKFLVNAGIYVLDPEMIRHIPPNTRYDMTMLFEKMTNQGVRPSVFPIREYWLDIGHIEDYNRAVRDFRADVFEAEE
jgi:dTDP-glucose pyrophosphorylase